MIDGDKQKIGTIPTPYFAYIFFIPPSIMKPLCNLNQCVLLFILLRTLSPVYSWNYGGRRPSAWIRGGGSFPTYSPIDNSNATTREPPSSLAVTSSHLGSVQNKDCVPSSPSSSAAAAAAAAVLTNNYTLLSESVLYAGHWRKLMNRRVQFPPAVLAGGQTSSIIADFEIVTQAGTDQAVLIFVWNSTSQTTTMVREYMPAPHAMTMGLAAGVVEADKHDHHQSNTHDDNHHHSHDHQHDHDIDTRQIAACYELEEECHLTGGTWFQLATDVILDKYSTTRMTVFLVIDPVHCRSNDDGSDDQMIRPRDEMEQGMEIVSGITLETLLNWITTGKMTVVGSWASLLALQKLRELGQIR